MPESIFTLCTRSMKPLGKEFQCNGFIKLKGYMNSEDTFLLPFILKYIYRLLSSLTSRLKDGGIYQVHVLCRTYVIVI